MKVYSAIAAVMAELAKDGVSKDRKNAQQGYNFRGIDDMYNALSGPLSRHGLVVIPRVLSRHCDERLTAKGSPLFFVTVQVEFDIVCAEDGSKHTAVMFGEAMDSADKATNKAMSAAYKYLAMELFCIPTEGDNDADATTYTVQAKAKPEFAKPVGQTEWEALPEDRRAEIEQEVCYPIRVMFSKGDIQGCVAHWNEQKINMSAGEQVGAWHQLRSDVRSAIKRAGESAKVTA